MGKFLYNYYFIAKYFCNIHRVKLFKVEMLDIKSLRDDIDHIKIELKKRGYSLDVKKFKLLDSNRKLLQVKVEDLQAQRKKLSEEFGKLKLSGDDTANLKLHIDEINNGLKKTSNELDKILESLTYFF